MKTSLNRREFLSRAVTATTTAAAVSQAVAATETSHQTVTGMATGRIGKLAVSRLISGGNLISGWAHSRDLTYVPSLMRAYNTEDKVLETLAKLEEHGVNAIIADPIKKPMEVLSRHWKRGGRIQWIAEGHPDLDDWKTNLKRSIDFGAAAVYVQGVIGDKWYRSGDLDRLGDCVSFIKSQGVPAGIGAHKLEVIVESERRNFGAEFYVKTLHHADYWSRQRQADDPDVVVSKTDNYWDLDPAATIRFMSEVEKPWIAFKVLAAGAIPPESGFKYALENGADFLCVGMFDFQVAQNAGLVGKLLASDGVQRRQRGWVG
jgi:hypothetical protein